MATPIFSLVNVSFAIDRSNALVLSFDALDSAGAAVDIDTGYTARIPVRALVGFNDRADVYDLATIGVMTYLNTGKVVCTVPYDDISDLPNLQNQIDCYLSNDAGATEAHIATGNLLVTSA